MRNASLEEQIDRYLKQSTKNNETIVHETLYQVFPQFKQASIRQAIRRMTERKKLIKVKNGVYVRPQQDRILQVDSYKIDEIYREIYLEDENGKRIGYVSGINFANSLGLTTQTSSIPVVRSNAVSNKKRNVDFRHHALVVDAPRVPVTDDNYRLLQVLDLLTQSHQMIDCPVNEASLRIRDYLCPTRISRTTVEEIVGRYPLIAQLNFYKMEIDHVFA